MQPHEALLLGLEPSVFLALSTAYSNGMTHHLPTPPPLHSADGGGGARGGMSRSGGEGGRGVVLVGYLSSDFTAHATTHLLKGVFALHNSQQPGREKQKVHAVCLDLAPGGTAERGGKGAGAAWHDEVASECEMVAVPADQGEAVALIRSLRLDAVVDLNGWTAGQRSSLLSARLAPLQILYLGYPATSGSSFMDYFLTDATASPPEFAVTRMHYSEKLLHYMQVYTVVTLGVELLTRSRGRRIIQRSSCCSRTATTSTITRAITRLRHASSSTLE
jgi:hypothetical protein